MALLGHITPEVINIFLSEAADLLGQWDEACVALESGSDPREALLWISRTTQSLRRASRGIGFEEFSQTLGSAEEYLRMVLRASSGPGPDVAVTLMMTHGVLSRWVVGLRTDAQYREDLSDLNDSIRQQKARVHEILEEEKRITDAKSFSNSNANSSREEYDAENANRAATAKSELENSNWDVLSEGSKRIEELIGIVAKIATQQSMVEYHLKSAHAPSQDLQRLLKQSSNLISELCESSVGLRFAPMTGLFERLAAFAIESAQCKGCAIQLDYEGHSAQIDKGLLASLWEPMSKIVRWMVEHSFETPEERVRFGKLPMGVLRIIAAANGSTVRLVLEDDGRGQGDGDSTPQGQMMRNFIDSARGMMRELSASMVVHSVVGKSTRIEITLPASPRLLDLAVVACGEQSYAIPNLAIEEVIEPGTFSTHILRGDKQLIEFNGKLYPFVTLIELLEKAPTVRRRVQASVAIEKGHVILVRFGRDSIAVGIDSVLNQVRAVVTPLPHHLLDVRGLAGTLIAGDGQPVLVIDVLEIAGAFLGMRREREAA